MRAVRWVKAPPAVAKAAGKYGGRFINGTVMRTPLRSGVLIIRSRPLTRRLQRLTKPGSR